MHWQDAEKGSHKQVEELLRKHDGKLFRELAINASAQEELREGDRRHAITEILFFASIGDIKRMHGLCLVHDINVSCCNVLQRLMYKTPMHGLQGHPAEATLQATEQVA